MVRCVLVLPDGPSRRVGASGVLIGRQKDCDIVADDASVSRRHAHVRLTPDGAEVVPLGKTPIVVNGVETSRPHALADGDELRVPGLVLKVMLRPDDAARDQPTGFVLERDGGGSFGVLGSPFSLGGADGDDLILPGWPAQLVALFVAQGELFAVASAEGVTRNGEALEAGEPVALAADDTLAYSRDAFRIRHFGIADATTKVNKLAPATRVLIELLPRGGRLTFVAPDGERTVTLADRRLDLLVALLRPPAGHSAGDFIPDDVVRAIVWPRNPGVSRNEINTLISRCRRDLVQAGLAGPRMLERAPNGGATRIVLAAGATVELRT